MFKKAAGAFALLFLLAPFFTSAQSTCPTLTLGSTGARVTEVQTILQSAYTNFPTPTGYFGPLTQAALKQWQEEHSLEPVGIVGPKTAAAMKLSCTTATPAISPIATVPSNPAVTPSANPEQVSTLVRGLSGADVLTLQQFLITQKLLPADSATGFFGALTEAAVKAFQSQNKLVSTGAPSTTGYGAVGPKTRAVMTLTGTESGGRVPDNTTTTAYLLPPSTTYVPPTPPVVLPTPTSPIVPSTPAPAPTPPIASPAPSPCSFNGQSIASGATVTAYQSSSVASGSQCVSQSRVCSNGVLSGTYTNASCGVTGLAAPSCSISYTPSNVSSGQPYVINWTSQNATSRLYSVKKPDGAYLVQNGGVAIGTGTYTDTTASSQLAPGTYTRTDTVTGAGGTATCTAAITITAASSPASCSFNGQTVAHGASVTAYQASSVAYGSQCASQTRTCTNGTLIGSYTNAACTVAPAPAQSPIVVQTSSSAAGYPASNMLDSSVSTAWVASLDPIATNNFAWIQLDLGSRRYINTIGWTSATQPYPASALQNYVIKISDNGTLWTPVVAHFEPPAGAPVYTQKESIGRNARYIRIETTKVNDASGWAASIAELSVTSEPQKDLSYACDVTITPSEDHISRLGSLRGGTSDRWTNVCLQPGTYAGAVRIHDAQYLRILAPSGGVTFTASIMAGTAAGGNSAPFNIWDSHDISIQNIKTINTYTFTTSADSTTQWSHALKIIRAKNITLENTTLVSNGKQAVYLESSDNILFNGGSISGYYFLLSPANQNSIYAYNVSFTTDGSAHIPGDEHSMFWVDAGDVVFDSSYFNMVTGKGLFTGGGSPRSRLVITGATRASGLSHWADNHQNYSNIHVYVTGTYPALTPFYNYADGGNAANSFVCTYSGASAPLSSIGCSYPLR
ncbi:MAG: hypothetical protein Athens041674_816 [Parcubacteria group bacterium Athens0416_74]|nr:MAG: hypothetical protein Athens041674_816 [Parcubacteria group bacterium Athens0416_74]